MTVLLLAIEKQPLDHSLVDRNGNSCTCRKISRLLHPPAHLATRRSWQTRLRRRLLWLRAVSQEQMTEQEGTGKQDFAPSFPPLLMVLIKAFKYCSIVKHNSASRRGAGVVPAFPADLPFPVFALQLAVISQGANGRLWGLHRLECPGTIWKTAQQKDGGGNKD